MLKPRYLGRQSRIRALYEALSGERRALHPVQLSKQTGMDMFGVQRQLDACPELFVKLPRNPEGLVRWRLTSTAATLEPEAVDRLIGDRARTEQLTVTAWLVVLVSVLLVVLLTVVPATSMGL
ncbi:MAG: hypothetical protein V2J24_16545 [Pseudomonadales bacterium]|jgi:hypothetical protein|nr:hypothetical protein [Pseudomonadales bacterium]